MEDDEEDEEEKYDETYAERPEDLLARERKGEDRSMAKYNYSSMEHNVSSIGLKMGNETMAPEDT